MQYIQLVTLDLTDYSYPQIMSHDDRPEEQCLLIIQTSMSTDLATKIQIHGSQERISWYSCLQALLDQAGVYELHYAIRESEIPNTVQKSGIDPTVPMDILICKSSVFLQNLIK